MFKLGLAFALAVSVTGCATQADTHVADEDQALLGTWLGNWDGAPVRFSFTDDGTVVETYMDDGQTFEGTFALVNDEQLTLDFGGGDAPTYRIAVEAGALEFVDQGYSFQQLSACGGAPF